MNVLEILDALSSSEIVLEIAVIVLIQEPGRQALRIKASLRDGYTLYINEAIGHSFRSYSYHVLKSNSMVRRWDCAPHWPEMKTFPHHVHLGDEKAALECHEVFIDEVLEAMEDIIKSEKL
ncbi:MAG: toxin-antitoxin system TumE family protein [Methanotrichaceae archaeon]